MIDAAIGGKTGVNLPQGKIWSVPSGSHQACYAISMPLQPCRSERVRCGNGEMAKYHFLTGDDLAALDLEARVGRCVEIKAEVVASDERESGRRAILNYGHTLAHALEIAFDHDIAHGEAVSIGLIFAARPRNDLAVSMRLALTNISTSWEICMASKLRFRRWGRQTNFSS